MIRRSGFVTMVGGALIVSACGRQVTPSPTNTSPASGVPSGFMQIKFRTVAPYDFTNYSYVVIFNTSGDGSTPVASGQQNAYAGYSFAVVVSAPGGTATPYIYLRPNGPGTVPVPQNVIFAQQDFRLQTNTNGQGTEFTVLFNRLLASGNTTSTPTPSPTASATASASPTASPTSSASPTTSPASTATPPFASTWTFNFFTLQGQFTSQQSQVVDSLGASPSGANDTTYSSIPLQILTSFDTGPIYPAAGIHTSVQAAQIASGDIANGG